MNNKVYYIPTIMYKDIENALHKNMYEIRRILKNAEVKLNENEIKLYLKEKLNEENPYLIEELKQPINGYIDLINPIGATNHFFAELEYKRYKFEPYTLIYYKKYIYILKNKCLKLLEIIDGIVDETIPVNTLEKLDIVLEKGFISHEDIIRLTIPFIYNYNNLVEKLNKANNLETYYTNKISLDDVYRNGCSESELYPKEDLQNKNMDYIFDNSGYVPLTENQKELIREKNNMYLKHTINIMNNYID